MVFVLGITKSQLAIVLTLCALVIACQGCMIGPTYTPVTADVPESWHKIGNVSNTEPRSYQTVLDSQVEVHCEYEGSQISSQECPWWEVFLDEDMQRLTEVMLERSPTLHETRARVDQAWQQRWVIRNGFYPHFEFQTGHAQQVLNPNVASNRRDFANTLRADMGWELDVFGGRRRESEAADRNIESQVESWRLGVVFLTGEIGLYYTDYRVAEARVRLQRDNVAFYEEITNFVSDKLELGGAPKIDLDEAKARLIRERAALPELERLRESALVSLANAVGIYSESLEPLVSPNRPIPAPNPTIVLPSPARVLMARPDVRRQERKVAGQVAQIGVAWSDFYPRIKPSYAYNAANNPTDFIRHAFVLSGLISKRIVNPKSEIARVKEQEIGLQRELHTFQQSLITAAAEVEGAIVDVNRANEEIVAQELAVSSNQEAFQAVYDAYREGLVDVRDIIRIRNDLITSQTELIFAQNLLAKATVRLYKAVGGIDVPHVPASMTNSTYQVADSNRASTFLSRIFSLNRDTDGTLHIDRREEMERTKAWYHISPDGLRPGPGNSK